MTPPSDRGPRVRPAPIGPHLKKLLPLAEGERGFALMSQRWHARQHVMVSPTTIGDIVESDRCCRR